MHDTDPETVSRWVRELDAGEPGSLTVAALLVLLAAWVVSWVGVGVLLGWVLL